MRRKFMLKKIHNILGKMFLSGASFFWASCDPGTSAEKPSAIIDIDQELAKIKQPDTTGLIGQCISAESYCHDVTAYNAYYLHAAAAGSIAREKIDTLLNANKISKAKYDCFKESIEIENMPLYGVSSCYELSHFEVVPIFETYPDEMDSLEIEYLKTRQKEKQDGYQNFLKKYNLTECDTAAHKVFINEQYINEIFKNDQYERKTIREKLEKINEKFDKCDM